MSPGRQESSGEEVSLPPNTPEVDRSLEVIRQRDESRLGSVDKYGANRKSGGPLESSRPVEFDSSDSRI